MHCQTEALARFGIRGSFLRRVRRQKIASSLNRCVSMSSIVVVVSQTTALIFMRYADSHVISGLDLVCSLLISFYTINCSQGIGLL